MSKKINIFDIATRAGVSIATVSRVMNDSPLVKEETRQKVLFALKETNYTPNAIAKNLRIERSHTIGFISTGILMCFYNLISKGIEDIARSNKYNVFFCNSDDDPVKEKQYLTALSEKRVDGIILSPTGKNVKLIEDILSFGIPICLFDRSIDEIHCDRVTVNNRDASCKAVRYMLDKGYRRIGFISGPVSRGTGKERYDGFVQAFRDAGIPMNEELVAYGNFTLESGVECTEKLLSAGGFDVLYVANERMAVGALQCLSDRDIRIPRDTGFLMWDDPYWTTLLKPKLSAISQPVYTIGTTAADLIFKRILKGDSYIDKDPIRVTLDAKLIIRESL